MSANTAVPQTSAAQVQVEEAVLAGHKRKAEEVIIDKNQKVGTPLRDYHSNFNITQQ